MQIGSEAGCCSGLTSPRLAAYSPSKSLALAATAVINLTFTFSISFMLSGVCYANLVGSGNVKTGSVVQGEEHRPAEALSKAAARLTVQDCVSQLDVCRTHHFFADAALLERHAPTKGT